ncbi:YjbH domain-containing protein, partial [Leptospira borgpetersenii serovar Balcanica]|nr:YjbH domain-containing protein [Leptospira borgpetersenii serovar Balcanica]
MKRKLCAPPHFNYKHLVLALSSCLTLSINANAQNQTQSLTTTLDNSSEAIESVTSTSNHSRMLAAPADQRMGGWLSQELNNNQNSGFKPNSKSDFKPAYEPYYAPAMAWQSSAEVAPQREQQTTLITDLDHLLKSKSSIKNNLLSLKQWLQS